MIEAELEQKYIKEDDELVAEWVARDDTFDKGSK